MWNSIRSGQFLAAAASPKDSNQLLKNTDLSFLYLHLAEQRCSSGRNLSTLGWGEGGGEKPGVGTGHCMIQLYVTEMAIAVNCKKANLFKSGDIL